MYDPAKLAKEVEEVVCSGDRRRYYRFRPARFYGGISTADCVGCCLRCVFCWSFREVANPHKFGSMYSPEEVASKLVSMAKRKGFRQMRVSGNEPTIGREHLIKVLELIPAQYLFILETNGILVGSDPSYADELSRFPNLHVRVSLKGASEEEFSRLTGAVPEGFELQLNALENLRRHGVRTHAACMVSFSNEESVRSLRRRLGSIDPEFEDFEVEELILYPSVEARLQKSGVNYFTSHMPDRVPPEQV
jgi:uncharacterized Fe-S cluster-containing radical SAM superfamily protein